MIGDDDDDFDPQEAYPMVDIVMREDDLHDRWLDSYQAYGDVERT